MSDAVTGLNAALEGRYRVERELGEGGMATVYLADDLRHERNVALKVLKPELAAVVGAERFLAEIKTTANLQHPHILPLFDSGEADGFLFYVMPYVEGESLRQKLEREHQLPVDEAVRIATDMAEALDYAHHQGVIHRDIKPGNVLIHAGQPVISDFGIALAVGAAGGDRMTETGLSLGTPHYMSPEQATGDQTVGTATDTYALGCVLYEMLVGDPPYTGSTAQSVLGKIVTSTPVAPAEHRGTIPPNVDAAVRRSLEKLPADRFASAGDFAGALSDQSFRHGVASGGAATTARGLWNPLSVAMTGLAVLGFATAGVTLATRGPVDRVRVPTTRVALDIQGHSFALGRLTLSPDASLLALISAASDGRRIYLRRSDSESVTLLPGTEGAQELTFSPDGRWILFARGEDLLRMSVDGGPAQTIARTGAAVQELHWGEDGSIVFMQIGGIFRIPTQGAEIEQIIPSPVSYDLRFPRMLPDGKSVLYTDSEVGRSEIRLLSLEGGEVTTLVTEGSDPRYLSSGYLVYGHPRGSLHAVRFDLRSRSVTGEPIPIQDSIGMDTRGIVDYDVSESGTAVYVVGSGVSALRLVLLGVDGQEDPLPIPLGAYRGAPAISPDGTRLAYTNDQSIFVYNMTLGTNIQLTSQGFAGGALWSPEGDSIVYYQLDGGRLRIVAVDGSGAPVDILERPGTQGPLGWSADGSQMLISEASNLLILTRGAEPAVTPYLEADWAEEQGRVSPDGRWVVYESDEEGRTEIFVRAFPEPGEKWKVSENGGLRPRWSRDGSTVYYRSGADLVAARLTIDTSVVVESRETVFSGPYGIAFDVLPDGRFVIARLTQDQQDAVRAGRMVLAVNWGAELAARMGGKEGS